MIVGLNLYIKAQIRSVKKLSSLLSAATPPVSISVSPSSGRSTAPIGDFRLVSTARTRWWSCFVKSTSDKGDSKRKVFWCSDGFSSNYGDSGGVLLLVRVET